MTDIRLEVPSDALGIRDVLRASFPTGAEAGLVERLRDGGHLAVSLVATDDRAAVIGHVGFSPVIAASGATGLGLAPLSVVPAIQGHGVGTDLVHAGLASCMAAGAGWVVVLGDPAYYARFGFRPASLYGLSDEYGGGDAFQVVELVARALPYGAGLVRYGEEFAGLG